MTKPIVDEVNELRDLMTRVMDAPLSPVLAKVDVIDARLRKLEGIVEKNVIFTNQLNETVNEINKGLKNSFADLNDDFPEVVDKRIAPLKQGLSDISQQQVAILGTINENQKQALALATSVRDSMKVCDGTVQTAIDQLQQLNINAKTSEKYALDVFDAVKANQITVEPALLNLKETSIESAHVLQTQQLLIIAFQESLPTLLRDMRQELDASLLKGLESTQISILSSVERHITEQQQGLLARLKLLKTLTFINLFALTCAVGLGASLFIWHG